MINIPDIFLLICDKLSTMKEIIKLELISKYHTHIIRNHTWNKKLYIQNTK